MRVFDLNPNTMPGPGDLGSPPDGGAYGPCGECGDETDHLMGEDADEDGRYVWFLCAGCDETDG